MVIPIDFQAHRRSVAKNRVTVANKQHNQKPITQARLAEGLQLHLAEMRVAQALRDFRLQLEADFAAGSEPEAGDLFFDRDLKIVRRKAPSATAGR